MSEHQPDEPKRWLDHRKNVDRIFYALVAACGLLLLVDLVLPKHGHFGFEEWFGFHALYGFVAYVGIVTGAKGLRWLLKRKEDYYE